MFNPLKLISATIGIFKRGLEYDRMVTEVEIEDATDIVYDKAYQGVSAKNQVIGCIVCDLEFVLCNGDLVTRICPRCQSLGLGK